MDEFGTELWGRILGCIFRFMSYVASQRIPNPRIDMMISRVDGIRTLVTSCIESEISSN